MYDLNYFKSLLERQVELEKCNFYEYIINTNNWLKYL